MKTKKMIATLFALISLSFFSVKSFGQVSITSNSFNYSRDICYKTQTVQVFELEIENLYTNSQDSVYIEQMSFQAYSSSFTLSDSLFVYESGKKITDGKFASGSITLNLNKWIKPGKSLILTLDCKTYTVSQNTDMQIHTRDVSYLFNLNNYYVWPNLNSIWFNTYDCTAPVFDIITNNFFNSECYEFGDMIFAYPIKIYNPNNDSLSFERINFLLEKEGPWAAGIDSIYLFDNRNRLLSKGELIKDEVSLSFNKTLSGLEKDSILVFVKAKSYGQLSLRIKDYEYLYQKVNKSKDYYLSGPYNNLNNCKPEVELNISTPNNSKTVCQNDNIGINSYLIGSTYDITKVEYFINSKLTIADSSFANGNYFPYHNGIELFVPKTTIIVKVTDTSGRVGFDSITLNVLANPVIKITTSSTEMCEGDFVTFTADTIGLSKWSWNQEQFSNTTNTSINFFTGGRKYFTGLSTNGCITDTSVLVYEIPAQEKPKVTINNWVLGSSITADSFIWYSFNDSLQKLIEISNSNKMFIGVNNSGYYAVKAFNEYGCFEISDIVWHSGWIAKDSLPHVRLLISNLKTGNGICEDDKVYATRKVFETTSSIVKEEWFLNGVKLPFKPNQLYDGMEYLIPTTNSTIKLLVIVTDKIGQTAKDSFDLTVYKNPKVKLNHTVTTTCLGGEVLLSLDTMSLSKWKWNGINSNNPVYTIKVYEKSIQFITIYSKDGCRSDSSVNITVLPAQERLVISSYDTILWISQKAKSIEWYYNDEFVVSDKKVITSTKTGFYQVLVTSEYGCQSYSDLYYFSYTPLTKDTFIFKDTIIIVPKDSCLDIPNPILTIWECLLYADINISQDSGIWQWYKGDTLMASTGNPNFETENHAWFKVKFLDKGGCLSKYSNAVFGNCNKTLGFENIENVEKLKAYPNPFVNQLTIKAEIGSEVVFINTQGQVAFRSFLVNDLEQFDLGILPKGLYFLQIFQNEQVIASQKIIKQ